MITRLSELYFRFRRVIILVEMKKVMSTNLWRQHKQLKTMEMSEVWPDIYLMRNIYINSNLNPLTKFTSSSRSTEFKDILPCIISQMIMKTIPVSMRIVISNVMKWGIPLWMWWKFNGNWDNNMIRISQWRKAIAEQILASEEINKSKRAGLWESQSGIRVGKLTIWVGSFEIEKLWQSSPGRSVPPG